MYDKQLKKVTELNVGPFKHVSRRLFSKNS